MSWATCPRCGSGFERDAAWKRTCLPCWKATKREAEARQEDRVALLAREVLRLRDENAALRARIERPATAIPPDMRRALVQLCHPDKHAGSALSGQVTAWLLSLRGGR